MKNMFEMVSGVAIVSDPCYKKDGSYQERVENVRKGKWLQILVHSDEGSWGRRVAELVCIHENARGLFWQFYDDNVGVDSGQAGVFDEQFYANDEDCKGVELTHPESPLTGNSAFYDLCCDLTLPRGGKSGQGGVLPHGAVSASGFGDGCYTLLVAEENDEVVGFRILFIDTPANHEFFDYGDEDDYDEEEDEDRVTDEDGDM